MIKVTDRNGNSVTLGMLFGGAVQHAVNGAEESPCGRYVVRAGQSDAPVCKSCVRILGLTVRTTETRVPGDCERDHRHYTLSDWEGKTFTPFQLSMMRDVVDDYNNGADNDPCWVAVCTAILANGGKKITPDVKTPELTKRQGGHNPNAGLINPHSTSVAKPVRKRGCGASEKQISLIKNLISQIREINSEAADILETVYTDEWLVETEWKKISAGIDALFAAKRNEENKAREIQAKEIKSAREWRRNQVYVIDGVYHRVHISQSTGRPYTQSWNAFDTTGVFEPGATKGEWVYQGMKFLKACTDATACTAEQAKAWAHEHDSCVFCHKPLDDQRSRNAGYGSTCADNNGLPWGE